LFRYCQRIVNLNAKIPDGALNFAMAEQKLDRAQISYPAID
jgi:hypothetical protein